MTNSFINFYDSNDIIPVRQFDSMSVQHFRRRTRLYSQLSVPMEIFKGKSILEIGAGTGENSRVCMDFSPSKFSFLDASQSVVKGLGQRFNKEISDGTVEVFSRDMNETWPNHTFDFVIAEACIPGQKNPLKALESVSALVAKNGYLIFTTQSASSLLPEILRRILALQLKSYCKGNEDWIQTCLSFFEGTLRKLKGMSRNPEDWVLDVLIHPWHEGSQVFEYQSAFSVLNDDFNLVGLSPNWVIRDNWYKDDIEEKSTFHSSSIEVYRQASVFLMDKDERACEIHLMNKEQSEHISVICTRIYEQHLRCSQKQAATLEDLELLHELLNELNSYLKGSHSKLHQCIEDFVSISNKLADSFYPKEDYFKNKTFENWWGRGQQYCAFQRI